MCKSEENTIKVYARFAAGRGGETRRYVFNAKSWSMIDAFWNVTQAGLVAEYHTSAWTKGNPSKDGKPAAAVICRVYSLGITVALTACNRAEDSEKKL